MLKIINTPFGGTAHGRMLEKIRAITENKERSLLIVPEQETVLAESELADILPPYSPLYFEATNFTRLSNSVFRALGGISGEYCDAGRRSLIMWRTLTELSPVLKMTERRREINSGLVERALGAAKELQSAGISIGDVSDIMENEKVKENRRLLDKLSDLVKISALYKTLLAERYSDADEDVDAMIKKLSENPSFLSDTEIFIEGFTSFTEPQYELIALLSARTDVSVIFTMPHLFREQFPYTEIRCAEERLISKARHEGSEIRLEKSDARLPRESTSIDELIDRVWLKSPSFANITLQDPDEIRIFEASTPFEEASFVAADIKRRVMRGDKYSDFAIIARDTSPYLGILDTALSAESIPYFISHRRDVSAYELIKLIYTAYSIIMRGYAAEDVITYSKCALSGLTHAECDELEGYINTWSLSGTRFTDGESWNMNPRGYTAGKNEKTAAKLLRINAAREKLIAPLYDFGERVKDAKTVREHAEILFGFLTRLGAEQKLAERTEALLTLGERELAEENSKLWAIVCDALDVLVEVSGECAADTEGFFSQLKILFSCSEVGRIPSMRDTVTVGSADMLRLRSKKHIYLIGVNAGKFPAAVNESSYFSEGDKLILRSLGLAAEPELETKSARELYIFMRALSYAKETVTMLYSARDTRQKATEPSEAVAATMRLTGLVPKKISSLPLEDRIFSPLAALELTPEELSSHAEAVRAALIENGYAEAVRISEGSITNSKRELGGELVSELYSGPLALTQSRIDSHSACPLAYFCKFTLGLREEDHAEFDAAGIGTFVHAILENFFSSLIKDGLSAKDLTPEDKVRLTEIAAKKYLSEIGEEMGSASARTKIKLERLSRAAMPVVDGLCEEFSESLFEPRFFELSINKKSPDSPEPIVFRPEGEGEVFVYGIIDRVDTYKSGKDVYIRVVDYKTGHKTFSPTDIEEGKNLQMFLYLKALLESEKESFRSALGIEDGGRAIPAGVIYVKTSVKDVRVDKNSDEEALSAFKAAQGREGMVLDSDEAIGAMGVRYTPLSSPKKPDEIAPTRRKFLFSEEDFSKMMQTVESSVITAAREIRSGKIEARPRPDSRGIVHCDFCEFKSFCRIAKIKK